MSTTADPPVAPEALDRVIIRFAGDSGDGMQLTGDRFTSASALFGNDLVTLPEYPAEIRAPAGTVAGVSAFQVHISDHDITTPGDAPNVLVAMNPAALRSELPKLEPGATVIINVDAFDERALAKAGYPEGHDPLKDGDLKGFNTYEIPMTSLTKQACEPLGVKPRDAERSKNLFALGLISWMYTRPEQVTIDWINEKFGSKPTVRDANVAAFRAGHAFGETAELFDHPYTVAPYEKPAGVYTSISGNTATAWGLVAASQLSKLPLFLGSYPITPASDILHELSKHKNFGVRTVQAEDEIAGIGAALGAAYGGHLAVTTTSGPGVALKSETIGLAISLELPLIIIDVQRGGPSTGLPTKTEQSDLMLAMYGHHGESPLPIVSASTPSGCFYAAIEAARIALKYRTPVFLLTDGYLANGAEPWLIPDVSTLPDISVPFLTEPNHVEDDGTATLWPYLRDPETLARPWVIPGTPGLEHRIGGIEKEDGRGNISYVPENHERMVHLRADKVAGIADDIPPAEVEGDADDAEVLLVGWGSTWGAINGALDRVRATGRKAAHVHLTHLNPFPANLGEILHRYPKVVVPEMNMGQLSRLLRAEYLVDAKSVTKVKGLPFTAGELETAILGALDD
jgi:2-oxoglutarate ferredoxin oxidoreductase subunit alpha